MNHSQRTVNDITPLLAKSRPFFEEQHLLTTLKQCLQQVLHIIEMLMKLRRWR